MKVEDYMSVIGRGWVIICSGDGIEDIHLGDRIVMDGQEFEVSGVERWRYQTTIGLVLRPNMLVPDYFGVGDMFKVSKPMV